MIQLIRDFKIELREWVHTASSAAGDCISRWSRQDWAHTGTRSLVAGEALGDDLQAVKDDGKFNQCVRHHEEAPEDDGY